MGDMELLRRYVQTRSEEAFGELVRRHIDWVYSAAVRQVRDRQLAEDVTQGVFIALARQAGSLRMEGLLSPWLFRVMRYAAATALRAEGRRKHHEQKAAAMRSESSTAMTEAEWERVAAALDERVAKLGAKDRAAVLLRFYERKSFIEVGEMIGVSEEAARKRVERAVERLRAGFAEQGMEMSSSMLGAGLVAQMGQRVSESFTAATTQAAAAMAGEGVAIAKGAMQMMAWAKMKLATMLVAVLGIVGTGAMMMAGGGQAKQAGDSVAIETAATVPADVDEDEAKVPGLVQLARWNVILDQRGAEVVRKVGKPVQTESKVYQAMVGNGVEMRRGVREAMAIGGLERISEEMGIAEEWPPQGDSLRLFSRLWFNYTSDGARVMIIGGSERMDDVINRVGLDRMRMKLNHPDMKVDINELTNQWQWAGLKGHAIVYDGEVAAGEAVAFLGQFTAKSGTPYYHLVVWETFKAERQQVGYMRSQRDAGWWCQNGPAKLRKWADAARVWVAQAKHGPSKVAAGFEKKLDDGKVVRLVALGRPERWPFCWWDAEGGPVAGYNGIMGMAGEPEKGLWATVEVEGKAEEAKLRTPTKTADAWPTSNYVDMQSGKICPAGKGFEVGVLVGPWKELARLEVGQPVVVDGVTYEIDRPSAFAKDGFLVHFKRTGVLEHEDYLTAVGADGKESGPIPVATIVFGPKPEQHEEKTQPNFQDVPFEKVEYFRLSQRKRQWVTFSGFAMEPGTTPQMVTSRGEVMAAEEEQARRKEQAKLDELRERRKGWAAVVADTSSPMGAVRMLVNAIKKGDQEAVRKLLVATRPEAKQHAEAVARLIVDGERLRVQLVERFGEMVVREKLKRWSVLSDLEEELMGGEWEKTADGAMESGGFTIRKDADGRYYVDIDKVVNSKSVDQRLQAYTAKVEKLSRLLAEKKTVTLEEVGAVVESP